MARSLLFITRAAIILVALCSSTVAVQEEAGQGEECADATKTRPPFLKLIAGSVKVAEDEDDGVLESVWDMHRRWSKIADRSNREVKTGRAVSLFLLFAGGAMQTLTHTLPSRCAAIQPLKLSGSVSVAAASVVKNRFLNKSKVQEWTHARAIAERIKSEVYRFRAAVPPYELENFYCVRRLVDEVTKINNANKELTLKFARTNISNWEKNRLPLPPVLKGSRDQYIEERFLPQLNDVFLKKANEISRKVSWLQTMEIGLLTASTTIGPLSNLNLGQQYNKIMKFLGGWPSTLTSGSMAIAAHIQAAHYEQEAEHYSNAAMKLRMRYLRLPSNAGPGVGGEAETEWTSFVIDCEELILDSTLTWAAIKNMPNEAHADDQI